jgi:hypothetical protein
MGFALLSLVLYFFSGAALSVSVTDPTGEGVQGDLVIVQDLGDHEREIVRALTDHEGHVAKVSLTHGLYRIIATNPYGHWQTAVRELLVRDEPIDVVIAVEPKPTEGYGDVATIPVSRAELLVLQSNGTPATHADVLARDNDATPSLERWYTTDQRGSTQIEIVAQPTVLVILFDESVFTTQFPVSELHATVRLPKR